MASEKSPLTVIRSPTAIDELDDVWRWNATNLLIGLVMSTFFINLLSLAFPIMLLQIYDCFIFFIIIEYYYQYAIDEIDIKLMVEYGFKGKYRCNERAHLWDE